MPLLAALFAQSAQAQDRLIAATFGAQGSPAGEGIQAFADIFQLCTNDQISVDVFADGSLGWPHELAEELVTGNIDVAILPASALQPFASSTGILSAPLVFYNRRHWEVALGGPVIRAINDDLADSTGLRVLGYLGGEQYGILSTAPITAPEDLEGRSIRVVGIVENTFEALGASPVPMAFAEIYTALATGTVDAAEATADFVVRARAFETASEFTTSNHRIDTDLIVMSIASIDALSDDARACLNEAAEKASIVGRDAAVSREQAALAALSEIGVGLHRIENRPALFERASAATWEFIDELEAEEFYGLILSSVTCPVWCGDRSCGDDECMACKTCD